MHSPRTIIDEYAFDAELLRKTDSLKMKGSNEKHQAYIYKRKTKVIADDSQVACDPLFRNALDLVRSGFQSLRDEVVLRSREEEVDLESDPKAL